jgi:hypothetical protein
MPNDKEIRSDAKLKNLPSEALEELWRFRNPEEGGTKLPLEEIAVEIPLRYGFTVSLSTLSEFYSWLRQKKRVEAAAERASQARLQLAKDPEMTPEGLRKVGQMIFTSEMIEGGDVKAFVELVKLQQQSLKLELERDKVELLKLKAAQVDAAKDVLGKQLSMEEQNRRLREILK